MESDAYWYLLENCSDIYGLLENDLNRINDYNKNKTSLKEVRLLLCDHENKEGIEELFLSNLSSKNIINKVFIKNGC